jgi:rare lipoprotein A
MYVESKYCMAVVLSMVEMFLRRALALAIAPLVIASLAVCSTRPPVRETPPYKATGLASYYGKKFHGRRTASGERFNMHAMTAAHRNFKFGTRVNVTNLKNKRSVTVRINDRGPFARGRIIDLSYAAAKKIGMVADGVVRVKIELVK